MEHYLTGGAFGFGLAIAWTMLITRGEHREWSALTDRLIAVCEDLVRRMSEDEDTEAPE
jgi:hypothetical protein